MEPTIYHLEVSFSGLLLKEVKPMPLDYCNNKKRFWNAKSIPLSLSTE